MKILVADDEFFARKAIVQMIHDWDESVIVLEAEDGNAALSMIEENTPDLVLTDIRMPGMDGIQLAAHLRNHHPSTLVIIISGYDDFTYAREAIRYKVENYLLKPIDRQELNPLLDQLKLQIEELQEVSLELALSSCLYGETDKSLSFLEAALDNRNYQTIIFLHPPSRLRECIAIAKEVFLNHHHNAVFLSDKFQPQLLIAWIHTEARPNQESLGGLGTICDRINRRWKELTGESCPAIGFSSTRNNLQQMNSSLKEAKLATLQSLIHGQGKAIAMEDIGTNYHYNAELIREWTGAFTRRATHYQAEEMSDMIRFWLVDAASKQFSIYMVQDWLAATVNIINTLIGQVHQETSSFYIEQPNLFEFSTVRDAGEELILKLNTITEQLKRSETKEDIVQDIKQYVEIHYKNRIVLEDLAKQRYYVDPSYLSRLFKRKCGMGFMQYLLSVRMEKAKKLLENSHPPLPVADVASEVGFNDYSYFIQMYKKFYGATPGKTRSEKRKNEE